MEQMNGSYEEISSSQSDLTRCQALISTSILAIGVDLLLISFKYLLGSLTGSSVLFADALHSGGDLAVSVIVLCSILVHYAFKDADWAKYVESLVALQISFLLALRSLTVIARTVSYEAGFFRLNRDIHLFIAIGGTSIVVVVIFAMSRFKRRIGEQYASFAFIAEGMHTKSDFFTSVGVWLTLFLSYFNVHLERIATLCVGLAVFHISVRLFFQAVNALTVVPKCMAWMRCHTPLAVKRRFLPLRDRFRSAMTRLRALRDRIPDLNEDWIVRQKYRIISGNVLLLVLLYIGTGLYSVQPHQTGLELFLGQVTEQNAPGLHIHAPAPFGAVVPVDTTLTGRIENGFRTVIDLRGEEPEAYLWEFSHTEGRYRKVQDEAIALTGDEMLIDANCLCYYRISDPVQFALQTANAREILRSLFSHEIQKEFRQYRLDDMLSSKRKELQNILLGNMRRAVTELPLGVEILSVYMREAHPPVEVVPSYRAVASSRENKIEIIHTAHTYANAILPLSRAQSDAAVAKAYGDAAERFLAARAETDAFLAKQQVFDATEAVQRIRLWWETLEKSLKGKTLMILPQGTRRGVYGPGVNLEKNPVSGSSVLRSTFEEEE